MRIVAFNGPMRSGKDTACSLLADVGRERGINVVRKGFADALKVSAARSLGAPAQWSVDECVEFCNDLKESGRIDVSFVHEEHHIELEGAPVEVLHEPAGPPITGRQFLQWYGTEAHRDVFGEDFWVDALLPLPPEIPTGQFKAPVGTQETLARKFPGVDVLAISDCRFVSEATRVLDLGGSVVRLVRPGTGEGDSHASEAGLPEEYVTHTLGNGGTVADLRIAVEALARELEIL